MDDKTYAEFLDRVRIDLADRDELEAYRMAAQRGLMVHVVRVKAVPSGAKVTQMHVLTRDGQCVLECGDWLELQTLVYELRPTALRKLMNTARRCPLHL